MAVVLYFVVIHNNILQIQFAALDEIQLALKVLSHSKCQLTVGHFCSTISVYPGSMAYQILAVGFLSPYLLSVFTLSP